MNANDTMGPESPTIIHLDDEQLLALLDERPGWDHAALRRHAGTCKRCREVYSRLEADAAVVAAWFAAAEPAPRAAPARDTAARSVRRLARVRGAWLKAAAVLVLLAAPAAAIPAVRGWIAARLPAGPAGGQAVAPAGGPAGGSAVRFAPAVSELVVRVEEGLAHGRLVIVAGAGAEARIELPSPDASATVSEVGVALRAGSEPGIFRLVVPPTVARVRVLGSGAPTTIDTRSLPAVVDFGG